MSTTSARLTLVFSCLGHGTMHLFTAFYFVIVLALELDWGTPYHELIELWTLGALLVGLGALPAGWIADRWSAAGMMVVFFVGLGLSGMACAFVDGPLALLIGLSAIGLFSAIYHPVGIAWLIGSVERQGRALGINGIFGNLGVAAAGLLAGGLIDLYGWRAAFFVPGLVSLLIGLALLVCLRCRWIEVRPVARSAAPASRGALLRVFIILVMTMFAMGMIFQATQVALPKVFDLRLRDLVGGGAFGIGALVAGVYAVAGLFQVMGGFLADRVALKPLYVAGFLLQVPACLLLAGLSGTPLVAAAMVSVLLTTAPLPAESMLVARFTPARHRGLAFGIKFIVAFGSAPLALLLVARVQAITGDFHWLFWSLAGFAALAALAGLLLPADARPAPAAAPAA